MSALEVKKKNEKRKKGKRPASRADSGAEPRGRQSDKLNSKSVYKKTKGGVKKKTR